VDTILEHCRRGIVELGYKDYIVASIIVFRALHLYLSSSESDTPENKAIPSIHIYTCCIQTSLLVSYNYHLTFDKFPSLPIVTMASLIMNMLMRRVAAISCTEIGPGCPLEDTIYGYRPSLAWNALFLAVFALSSVIHVIQGVHYKTWSFMVAMAIGGVCEAVGGGGRLMMYVLYSYSF
jgi:hypothetical protein